MFSQGMQSISIAGRLIGPGHPPYIVAELSANHNGKLERALETIEMAKAMGADAVKIQSYTPDSMTIDCDSDDFLVKGGLWDGYRLYELYEWAQTPYDWHEAMFSKAREIGITLFSSPFDTGAIELLEALDTPAYKIASFEAVDLPLIARAASTGKPLIISTGMANLEEIEEAYQCARDNGCNELALLHCVSSYPSPIGETNLRTISDMVSRFDAIVGLSDHTMGTTTAVAAIALGATIIEKHVTLSRADKGPDSTFSLEPEELNSLCVKVRDTFAALGTAGYSLKTAEQGSIKFRRSIYAVKTIKRGEPFTRDNVRIIRPGYGLKPKHFDDVIHKVATQDIERGSAITWEMIK